MPGRKMGKVHNTDREFAVDEGNRPGSKRGVRLHLSDNSPDDWDAVEKDLDSTLPKTWKDPKTGQEITITWFINVGVEPKAGKSPRLSKYKVSFAAFPPGKRIFAYHGGAVHEVSFSTSGDRSEIELNVTDPPLGSGP